LCNHNCHYLKILPPFTKWRLTWPTFEKLIGSWCCGLPSSSTSPSHDMPTFHVPPYNYHHHSLLFITPSCPTHHSRRRKNKISNKFLVFQLPRGTTSIILP
jgi:hypothetical protein